jgi:membrane fusion protein (multidrug efflux system)
MTCFADLVEVLVEEDPMRSTRPSHRAPETSSCGALRRPALVLSLLIGALVAGCGKQAAMPPPPPVPEVGVIKVEAKSTPLFAELVGDVRAFREVELRPRVSGVVEKQMFTPGQMVREG